MNKMKKFLVDLKETAINLFRTLSPIFFQEKYPIKNLLNNYQNLFRKNGLNICYNYQIANDYDPNKKNILIAIESPAIIEYLDLIKSEMKFVAEISFANFCNLEYYYCPRDLYAGNDLYVRLNTSKKYNKNRLISLIYSRRKHLEGHKLRYRVAKRYNNQIELFGSGTGVYLEKKIDSLDKYMFQIAIENGKYPEYVSEKFYDCLKTLTVPVYWGGETAIKKMGFDTNGMIFFDSIDELKNILEEEISKSNYNKKISALKYNLNRLIEIRNSLKLNYFLSTVYTGYLHGPESYHEHDFDKMALDLD